MQPARRLADRPREADDDPPDAADPGDLLRTPLQAARGILDMILCGEAGPLAAPLLSYLAELGQALDRLEAAVEQALPGALHRGER